MIRIGGARAMALNSQGFAAPMRIEAGMLAARRCPALPVHNRTCAIDASGACTQSLTISTCGSG